MEVGSPFGSKTRTRVLLALQLRGTSHARELGRLLGAPLSVVQKAVKSLEEDRLLVGSQAGRTTLLELDPRWVAMTELKALLGRLVAEDPQLRARLSKGLATGARGAPRPATPALAAPREPRVRSRRPEKTPRPPRPPRAERPRPTAPARPDPWRVW